MLAALAGIVILTAFGATGNGPTVLGDFLAFLGAVAFSVFAAVGKKVTARHDAITVNTFGYAGGAAMGGATAGMAGMGLPVRESEPGGVGERGLTWQCFPRSSRT